MPVELDPGWPRLRRSLDLADGFAFYLVFIDWPAQVDLGCRYLDDSLRLRTLRLQRVLPAASGELVSVAMDALLGGDCRPGRPVWLECWRHPSDDGWSEARRQLLARLNEGRGRLESTFRAPLVLLLPCDDVARTAEIAPDLWSVRRLTLRCERPRPEPAVAGATRIDSKPARDGRLAELAELAERRLAAWQRQSAGAGKANLADSWAAVESLRELGRLPEARRIASESLELSRQLRAALGDTPQTLRDLSVSLDNVGGVSGELGDLEAARAAYAESLELSRQLRTALGDTPQALRDLSVSLNKVGGVSGELGDLEAARAAYAESLELSRQLRAALGDTPQAAQDLAVSLTLYATVLAKQGDASAAREALRAARALAQDWNERRPAARQAQQLLAWIDAALAAIG